MALFNFSLDDGHSTCLYELDYKVNLQKFDPDQVRIAVLWHSTNILRGIQLLDQELKCVVAAGSFEEQFTRFEVQVQKGERIVGIKSLNSGNAYHFDF
jgi:hypothetical protein